MTFNIMRVNKYHIYSIKLWNIGKNLPMQTGLLVIILQSATVRLYIYTPDMVSCWANYIALCIKLLKYLNPNNLLDQWDISRCNTTWSCDTTWSAPWDWACLLVLSQSLWEDALVTLLMKAGC